MIIPIDKEKVLNEFKLKYVEGRFYEESSKIYEEFESKRELIKEKVLSKFKEGCEKALNLQNEGIKGEIKYIYFSYLRTSIMENKSTYRMDFFDDGWFMDKEECSINFNMDFIYKPLFKHMEELNEHKSEYGRTITEMDIEKIKLKEADRYNKIALRILDSFTDDFINCNEYKEMKKSEEIHIFAGEYMDQVRVLYESAAENNKQSSGEEIR